MHFRLQRLVQAFPGASPGTPLPVGRSSSIGIRCVLKIFEDTFDRLFGAPVIIAQHDALVHGVVNDGNWRFNDDAKRGFRQR